MMRFNPVNVKKCKDYDCSCLIANELYLYVLV